MANLNPYQAFTVAEPSDDSIPAVAMITDRFDEQQRITLLNSLKMVLRGHGVIVASAIMFGLSVAFRTSAPLAADSFNGTMMLFGVGSGLLVKLLGLSAWCSLPGPEKVFSILAMVLQVLAMFATGVFVLAAMNGRFVGGLFSLFGASAFAMLLTSQAIVSLVTRSWALLLRDQAGTHASELAVIGYAICASLCAASSMNVIPRNGQLTGVAFATIVSGIAALMLQLMGLSRTFRALKMLNAKDATCGIHSQQPSAIAN